MARGGAPTGKWESYPPHLEKERPLDLRQAEVRLKVRRPGVPEVEIAVDKTEFVIGRFPKEVDLVLDDELVSRRHARLTVDARGYFKLEDLGSQNGIRFQGRTVRRLNLIDGDRFQIGRTELEFHAAMERLASGAPRVAPGRENSLAEPPPVPDPSEQGPTALPNEDRKKVPPGDNGDSPE